MRHLIQSHCLKGDVFTRAASIQYPRYRACACLFVSHSLFQSSILLPTFQKLFIIHFPSSLLK